MWHKTWSRRLTLGLGLIPKPGTRAWRSANRLGTPISDFAANWLRTGASRISPDDVAERVWDELFHAKDRAILGRDLNKAWKQSGTAGMWMKTRGCSLEEAVIEIGEQFEFISVVTAKRLREELGLLAAKGSKPSSTEKPRFDDSTGKLTFSGEPVRTLRLTANATNIRCVVRAFQAAKWRRKIKNPLNSQHQLHETLRSLNNGLEKLRFRATEGNYATWEVNVSMD